VIDGDVLELNGWIYHDDREPLARWIASQRGYAHTEAEYLLGCRSERLSRTDKLRLMVWPTPLGVWVYTLLVKGCLLTDGRAGTMRSGPSPKR
jgi:hypothetical protein